MREKRDYQVKALYSPKQIVVCNWDRGKGKTYTLVEKIRKEFKWTNKDMDVLYIVQGNVDTYSKLVFQYLKEDIYNVEYEINNFISKIVMKDKDKILTIYFINIDNLYAIKGSSKKDYIMFDDCYPSKNQLDIVEPLLKKKSSQIYITLTADNVEYIDDDRDFNEKEEIKQQIKELYLEFRNVEKSDKTTIRREKILQQIQVLKMLLKEETI